MEEKEKTEIKITPKTNTASSDGIIISPNYRGAERFSFFENIVNSFLERSSEVENSQIPDFFNPLKHHWAIYTAVEVSSFAEANEYFMHPQKINGKFPFFFDGNDYFSGFTKINLSKVKKPKERYNSSETHFEKNLQKVQNNILGISSWMALDYKEKEEAKIKEYILSSDSEFVVKRNSVNLSHARPIPFPWKNGEHINETATIGFTVTSNALENRVIQEEYRAIVKIDKYILRW